MKAIVCEVCGSNDLVKQEGVFVCQYCGTKYSLDDVKKLYAEVSGTVKIDSSDDINNLYVIARRAVESQNYINGKKFYENILMKDSSSWEATFYSMYCQVMSVTKENYEDTIIAFGNCVNSVFSLIKLSVTNVDEQRKIILDVLHQFISCCKYLYNCSYSLSNRYSAGINAYNVSLIYANLGDSLINTFGNDYSSYSCTFWKLFVSHMITLFKSSSLNSSTASSAIANAKIYTKRIRCYDATFEKSLILDYSLFYQYRRLILIILFLVFCYLSFKFPSLFLVLFAFLALLFIFLEAALPNL